MNMRTAFKCSRPPGLQQIKLRSCRCFGTADNTTSALNDDLIRNCKHLVSKAASANPNALKLPKAHLKFLKTKSECSASTHTQGRRQRECKPKTSSSIAQVVESITYITVTILLLLLLLLPLSRSRLRIRFRFLFPFLFLESSEEPAGRPRPPN